MSTQIVEDLPLPVYMTVSHICPECGNRVKKSIPFIHNSSHSVGFTVQTWCGYRSCEARHKIEYTVRQKDRKKPEIKVKNFASNEEAFTKRFQILEWSGMESRTRNRRNK